MASGSRREKLKWLKKIQTTTKVAIDADWLAILRDQRRWTTVPLALALEWDGDEAFIVLYTNDEEGVGVPILSIDATQIA